MGHATDARVALAHRLVQSVDPSGFVYLPPLSPVTKDGPHLNEQQYQAVLRRSRFHVWCSHHGTFYMEFDRYRDVGPRRRRSHQSPLGPVAARIVPAAFSNLLLPFEDFASRLSGMDFFQARDTFLAEYEGLPTLEAELVRFFQRMPARVRSLPG